MTYQQLLDRLKQLTPEQLVQTVTVQLNFEWLPVIGTGIADQDDVLDRGHFYLFVD